MFYLQTSTGSVIYLLPHNTYTVGRRGCDILIEDDQSISRQHAILTVTERKVTVRDAKSKYSTFIDNIKIDTDSDVAVSPNSFIRFGMLLSIYKLCKVDITTTASNLNKQKRAEIQSYITFLGGSMILPWRQDCTHVTTDEVQLTIKVLCAIITGIPIVTSLFWKDYKTRVELNQKPPKCEDYIPLYSEMILSCDDVSLTYNPARKDVFSNKIFVFQTAAEKNQVAVLIKCAGGESISWDKDPITVEQLQTAAEQYLIFTPEAPIEKFMKPVLNYYTKTMGKRTIAIKEIAIAIVKCSCEKFCNPDFNLVETVFQPKTQPKSTLNILAEATQSQFTEKVNTEVIVMSTLDSVMPEAVVKIRQPEIALIEEPANVALKRERSPSNEGFVSKRTKTDHSDSSTDELSINVKEEAAVSSTPFKIPFEITQQKSQQPRNNDEVIMKPFAKKHKVNPKEVEPCTGPSTNQFLSTARKAAPVNADKKFASSTLNRSEVRNLEWELSAVRSADESVATMTGWFSKSSLQTDINKTEVKNESLNEELLNYIHSFQEAVVIEDPTLVVKKIPMNSLDSASRTDSSICSFKKFKKVKPLKMQTTIYPEADYVNA